MDEFGVDLGDLTFERIVGGARIDFAFLVAHLDAVSGSVHSVEASSGYGQERSSCVGGDDGSGRDRSQVYENVVSCGIGEFHESLSFNSDHKFVGTRRDISEGNRVIIGNVRCRS